MKSVTVVSLSLMVVACGSFVDGNEYRVDSDSNYVPWNDEYEYLIIPNEEPWDDEVFMETDSAEQWYEPEDDDGNGVSNEYDW